MEGRTEKRGSGRRENVHLDFGRGVGSYYGSVNVFGKRMVW